MTYILVNFIYPVETEEEINNSIINMNKHSEKLIKDTNIQTNISTFQANENDFMQALQENLIQFKKDYEGKA